MVAVVPRASEQIDDRTPLSAARIDVAARVGWLLRVHRTAAGMSLRQMSAALGEHGVTLSAATLSRAESEGQRSPQVLDGYGRVLGLPEGSLRAQIDAVCRAFSYAAPRPPEQGARDLAEYSRACDAVQLPAPTGSAWLAFARQHALPRGFGLPSDLMEPLVRQLAGEVGRGVAGARLVRHEAINISAGEPVRRAGHRGSARGRGRSRAPELLRPHERPLRPSDRRAGAVGRWPAVEPVDLPGPRRGVRPPGHVRERLSPSLRLATARAAPRAGVEPRG